MTGHLLFGCGWKPRYGLLKKTTPLESLHGLTLETGIVFLPALGWLMFAESQQVGAFGHASLAANLLLVGSGFVTTIPLILFGSAARRINLSTLGLLQYIAPTCQFLIGVLVYGETFTHTHLVGFSIIWLALLLYSAESIYIHRKAALSPAS